MFGILAICNGGTASVSNDSGKAPQLMPEQIAVLHRPGMQAGIVTELKPQFPFQSLHKGVQQAVAYSLR